MEVGLWVVTATSRGKVRKVVEKRRAKESRKEEGRGRRVRSFKKIG